MLSSKDVNFVGYTYKNFEIVNDHPVPGIGSLSNTLSCKSLFLLFIEVLGYDDIIFY